MEYTELKDLMESNRSYRRFDEEKRISCDELTRMVELCRYCASGRNLQPLRYRLVCSEKECAQVFPLLAWAGYLSDWNGPEEGERPAAYIVQCLDRNLAANPMCDDGLHIEAITLGSVSMGYGACVIKSFNKDVLAQTLGLSDCLEPLHVIALGVPIEKVMIEDIREGDVRYWRDDRKIHHVPKRRLEEILVK